VHDNFGPSAVRSTPVIEGHEGENIAPSIDISSLRPERKNIFPEGKQSKHTKPLIPASFVMDMTFVEDILPMRNMNIVLA
jgi:hypothetical protein